MCETGKLANLGNVRGVAMEMTRNMRDTVYDEFLQGEWETKYRTCELYWILREYIFVVLDRYRRVFEKRFHRGKSRVRRKSNFGGT